MKGKKILIGFFFKFPNPPPPPKKPPQKTWVMWEIIEIHKVVFFGGGAVSRVYHGCFVSFSCLF